MMLADLLFLQVRPFYVKHRVSNNLEHQGVNVRQHIWHLETSNGMGVFAENRSVGK